MFRLPMDDVWTKPKKRTGYLIPGGWDLIFGGWSVDPDREDMWRRTLMPEFGHDTKKALAEARRRANDMAMAYEKQAVLEFVKRMAHLYAKRFPDLVQPDKSLKGYDPESMQLYFLPFRESAGRNGDTTLRSAMMRMAESARMAAEAPESPYKRDGGLAA